MQTSAFVYVSKKIISPKLYPIAKNELFDKQTKREGKPCLPGNTLKVLNYLLKKL